MSLFKPTIIGNTIEIEILLEKDRLMHSEKHIWTSVFDCCHIMLQRKRYKLKIEFAEHNQN